MADHQAPDQVQPRGAEHGPEGQQEHERKPRTECCGLLYEHGAFTQRHLACHDCPDRQKETKP